MYFSIRQHFYYISVGLILHVNRATTNMIYKENFVKYEASAIWDNQLN